MIEHKVNRLDNFICGWYLKDSICDELIEYYKNSENKKPGVLGSKKTARVIPEQRDSLDIGLCDVDLLKKYANYLQKSADKYMQKYPYANNYAPWTIIDVPNIQYYKPGAGYHIWHTERDFLLDKRMTRHLTFITYLNDVDDAGETEFFHQKIKIKPEKGLTIIWPVDWTFTHRGIVSKTQEKYIVTGWYNFIEKKFEDF